jgi:uncharacterized protein (DUF1684 family)
MRTALLLLILAISVVAASYPESVEQWRTQREARLKSDTGWLTVAGLFWLKEGRNTVDYPGVPKGQFELKGAKVTWLPASGAPVSMIADPAPNPTLVEHGDLTMFVIERGKRFGIRVKDKNARFRREFTGLKWYPVKESWRITAKWIPYQPPKTISVPNILGESTEERCPGTAVFQVDGKEYRLEPTSENVALFFVFRDQTSGKETYGGGRFLYADAPKGGTVVLDFNKAYNPPCAFTPYATCPLPPPQNRLPLRIDAGELKYADH